MISERVRRVFATWAVLGVGLAGCGQSSISAIERGRQLVHDPKLSSSSFNAFACTHCHAIDAQDTRLLPGYSLLGAAKRPSFWGGEALDLKTAVDNCLVYFMKGDPLDPKQDNARSLYEFLISLEDLGPTDAQKLTILADTSMPPARGDANHGADLHQRACETCHGGAHTGKGAIGGAPVLPDQAKQDAMTGFPTFQPAQVFTEKIRHGRFFGVGGNMPPFSLEVLTEEDVGALLAFYQL